MTPPEPDDRPDRADGRDADPSDDVSGGTSGGASGGDRRITPGRVLLILVIAAVVLVVLFTWVFPWIEQNLSNPTLEALAAPLR